MKMRDSNKHNLNFRRFVNNTEGKTLHLTASNCAAERVPRHWKLLDAPDGFPRLVSKFFAQGWKLCVVVTNYLMEFTAGWNQEPCSQDCLPSSANT